MDMDSERYRFTAEWYDPIMKVKRHFLLTYFLSNGSVELYDVYNKRMFLKRIKCSSVDGGDIYVGSIVNIFSRQLQITGFGDETTKLKCNRFTMSTVAIVKSSGFPYLGRILDAILQSRLSISKGRMLKVTCDDMRSPLTKDIQNFAVFEVRGEGAIDIWQNLIGLKSTQKLHVGLGNLSEHCLGPTTERDAKDELDHFFKGETEMYCNTGVFKGSTCCIIKPHTLHEGTFGKIIQDILDAGFKITAMEFLNFDLTTAAEFYEVYKSVVDDYKEMMAQLMSGPCIGLEIVKKDCDNIVEVFRSFAGPLDSALAKKLRPDSIRAKYGNSNIENAVHCTDLPEDGKIEVEYVFCLMAKSHE